jgi:signal transduction histidine kinase/CheY-like chemotaxis protein
MVTLEAPAASPLEEVLITAKLAQRPTRLPDFAAESEALVELMKALQEADANILQRLAEAALKLCRAHSAGVNIEAHAQEHGRRVFRWLGAAGRWAPFLQEATPRAVNLCSMVLDRNVPLLIAHPERCFDQPDIGGPPLIETLVVPLAVDGATVGTVWVVAHDGSRSFDREDLRILATLSEFAAVAFQVLQRTEQLQNTLSRERAGSQLLQAISAGLICEDDDDALYQQILDAATTIMHSEFASIQMLEEQQLQLLAWRGFHPDSGRFWQQIRHDSGTSCGKTLQTGERFVIADIEQATVLAGSADLGEYHRSGIRAVQSTPLRARSGGLLGVISTHWRVPHEPTADELRLFDVLARLTADLMERSKADQALSEDARRKNEFLAVLSHELRNPLAPLTTGLELLRRPQNNPALIEGIHSMMDRQVSHLTRLVNDLLDLSRISRGTIELQCAPLAMRGVVEAAVELAKPLIDQRRHRLIVEHDGGALTVNGDLARLTQVVANVLGNAAKYTDAEGTIRLRAGVEDGQAVIRVWDSGLGIPPAQLEEVFEMFTQVREHRVRSGGGGLGIGLALCRRLVLLHGGSIEAASSGLGHGSEFIIRLPLASAADSLNGRMPAGVDTPMVSRKLLIVEDNVDAADTLRTALQSLGHVVRVARDGTEGLTLFSEFEPEIVLLDIGLPGMDGYDAARRIRQMAGGRNVSLVALTGWGQKSDRVRAADAGFDAHLTKPATLDSLASVLSALYPWAC